MNYAEMLKMGRKSRGLTLDESAEVLGISIAYLSYIENGKAKHNKMDFIYKAAALYGVSVDELCLSAQRVPRDVFFKLVKNPELLQVIRAYKL